MKAIIKTAKIFNLNRFGELIPGNNFATNQIIIAKRMVTKTGGIFNWIFDIP